MLRERHPRLITCDISGYGENGPFREMKAYDLLIQCETGLAAITGAPERPGRVGVSVADIACGMYAQMGILEALLERERTGKGSSLAVSLFDSIADWMTVPLLHYDYGGTAPPRAGLNHPSIAPYGAYRLGDGSEVVISVQNEREWVTFCEEVLGQPELAADPLFSNVTARVANRHTLDAQIAAVFGGFTRAAAFRRLREAKVAYGSVNSVADFSAHPELRRIETPAPSGPVSGVAPPLRRAGRRFEPGAVPAPGEHSEALRREFAE
jgi:itaconate CoA-transferase